MPKKLLVSIKDYSGITDYSENVQKNFIFIAVRGLKNDGHNFIDKAISKGATLVIGEKNIKFSGARYVKVKNSRETLGQLASEWFGNPSQKLKVIGVTGTKGKTTTVYLIHHILTSLGKKAGLVSSIVAKIGNNEVDTGFHVTSPDVISLHRFLKEMVDEGCKYAVIEVSSHGIDQKRIAGIHFDVGVLTNIAPEHLDYHKNFDEYKKIKMSFIKSADHSVISPKSTKLDILPGEFNNLNAEAAISTVSLLGISRKNAIKSISSFKLPEGRLEEIKNSLGIKIIIDFAHTPESLEETLKYLKRWTKGKLITVFGCAGERDPFKRPRMGAISAKYSHSVILTAEDPRTEPVENITSQIKKGIPESFKNVYEVPDREKAIKKSIGLAKKGDLVAIFGKGHEKSMNLDGITEIPWSDQKIVRKYIRKI